MKIFCYKTLKKWFHIFRSSYHPIDETANFTEYTNTGFDSLEQNRLANLFKDLDHRGCKIILRNSDTNLVRDIYNKFKIYEVDVLRSINSKPNRRSGYNELIIRNFWYYSSI
jgi:DNA adenine methylase